MPVEFRHLIVIGAQRSGTTRLLRYLEQSPEIAIARPVRPEPKFFLRDDWHTFSPRGYRKFCGAARLPPTVRCFVEKSTSYYELPYVADRIKRLLPHAEVCIILREPVARALSNFHFSRMNGLETRTATESFLMELPPPTLGRSTSVDPFAYLERGAYAQLLQPWFWVFGPDRLHVLFFEELVGQPRRTMEGLTTALRLNRLPELDGAVVNESHAREAIGAEVLTRLKSYYRPHNTRLAKFLDRDLPSNWIY